MIFFRRWVPECAKVLLDSKQHWTHLIPVNEGDSSTLIQKFFSCVAALMSIQLRSLVLNSLKDFLEFLKMYQVSCHH
jgi:dynein heavy chain